MELIPKEQTDIAANELSTGPAEFERPSRADLADLIRVENQKPAGGTREDF
jgi:hypothetical protein